MFTLFLALRLIMSIMEKTKNVILRTGYAYIPF